VAPRWPDGDSARPGWLSQRDVGTSGLAGAHPHDD